MVVIITHLHQFHSIHQVHLKEVRVRAVAHKVRLGEEFRTAAEFRTAVPSRIQGSMDKCRRVIKWV